MPIAPALRQRSPTLAARIGAVRRCWLCQLLSAVPADSERDNRPSTPPPTHYERYPVLVDAGLEIGRRRVGSAGRVGVVYSSDPPATGLRRPNDTEVFHGIDLEAGGIRVNVGELIETNGLPIPVIDNQPAGLARRSIGGVGDHGGSHRVGKPRIRRDHGARRSLCQPPPSAWYVIRSWRRWLLPCQNSIRSGRTL